MMAKSRKSNASELIQEDRKTLDSCEGENSFKDKQTVKANYGSETEDAGPQESEFNRRQIDGFVSSAKRSESDVGENCDVTSRSESQENEKRPYCKEQKGQQACLEHHPNPTTTRPVRHYTNNYGRLQRPLIFKKSKKIRLRCTYCSKEFKDSNNLKNHLRTHSLPSMLHHICQYCGQNFVQRYRWIRHLALKHSNRKPHRSNLDKRDEYRPHLKCQICDCDVFFSTRSNLIRHHKLKHGGTPVPPSISRTLVNGIGPQDPLKCVHCGKIFNHVFALRRHVRIHQPPGSLQLYSCKFCNKQFVHRSSWAKHMASHSDQKPYSCTKCDFRSKYHSCLYDHKNTCAGIRSQEKISKKIRPIYACDICGKIFFSNTGLAIHKAATVGKCEVFTCKVCGKKFYDKRAFAEHDAAAHTDEYPFPCPLCESKFKFKENLASHTRSSHKERWMCPRLGCTVELLSKTRSTWTRHLKECSKPIQCKTCEQIFESKQLYTDHSHTIQCLKCDKTYLKQSDMNGHILFHDPSTIYKCECCTFGFGSAGEFTTHHNKLRHRNTNRILLNFIERCRTENIYHFTCKFCDAEFEDPLPTELVAHAKTSHSDQIGHFICPSCGKGFNTEWNAFFHRNRIHGIVLTEFKCETCDVYFLTKHGMDTHNRKTHYEIPLVDMAMTVTDLEETDNPESKIWQTLQKYSCLICGKMCNKVGIRNHLNLHKMDKEFKCELCTRSWAAPDGLNKHNRVCHPTIQIEPIDNKCYECPHCDCGRKFTKSHYRRHIKFHQRKGHL